MKTTLLYLKLYLGRYRKDISSRPMDQSKAKLFPFL